MTGVDQKAAEVVAAATRRRSSPSEAELEKLVASIDAETGAVARADRIDDELVPMLARFGESAREAVISAIASKHKWASKTALRRDAAKVADSLKPPELEPERTPPNPDLVPGSYFAKNGRLWWVSPGGRSGPFPVPVANFEAHITEQVFGDDGSEEPIITYVVEGRLEDGRPLPPITVLNRMFDAMSWVNEWGAEPRVAAGPGMKDHARVAIKDCSSKPLPTRHRYRHIGWRRVGDRWLYLHAAGAIGAEGSVESVEVELSGSFKRYVLPEPPRGGNLAAAVQASLRMLLVAPLEVVTPVYAAMARAPLGMTDFSLFVAGDSGLGKTELAALAQRHWGRSMDRLNIPANWQSTANSLEVSAFIPKDALFVVDDFAPTGGRNDYDRWVKDADRFFRAVGNQAGRGRLGPTGQPQATRYPRCLPLATGEDIPHGLASMASRVFWIEVGPGDMHWDHLTGCQADASLGLYAEAMAGYVQWLAANHDEVWGSLERQRNEISASFAAQCSHKRTPRIVADLLVGLKTWMRYAVEVGAVTAEASAGILDLCAAALLEVAKRQTRQQTTRAPARRFLDLLRAAIVAGRAHIADAEGQPPKGLETACGWRLRQPDSPRAEWVAQGARIGWIQRDEATGAEWLWLHRDTSYSIAQEQGRGQNDAIAVSVQTLGKRLNESGYLAWTDQARETLTVRRSLEGVQQVVYCLTIATLLGDSPDTDFGGSGGENPTNPTSARHGNQSINLKSLLGECRECREIPTSPGSYAGAHGPATRAREGVGPHAPDEGGEGLGKPDKPDMTPGGGPDPSRPPSDLEDDLPVIDDDLPEDEPPVPGGTRGPVHVQAAAGGTRSPGQVPEDDLP